MKLSVSLVVAATAALASATAATQTPLGVKQLYHVTAPKTTFDLALDAFGDTLDVWSATATDGIVKADIYATEADMAKFHFVSLPQGTRSIASSASIHIERDAVDRQQLLQATAASNAACKTRTSRHLQELTNDTSAVTYTEAAFFDCWRTADEIYAFLDTLVAQNPTVFSKIDQVSTSYEGRVIPGYKISSGPGKKAVYVQGLIHAREWHAGSTVFYTIAALLDGLRHGDEELTALVSKYDWYFVPIVNIDGFLFTYAANGNRYWRRNRRPLPPFRDFPATGVDLNRNFGPLEYFNRHGAIVLSEVYAGTAPLSEPETAGLFAWLKSLSLVGALDVHAYAGQIHRPLGNKYSEAPEPYGSKLKAMGDRMKAAIEVNNTHTYTSMIIADLYPAYGTFTDSIFLEFNHTAAMSFEMEGDDFVQPESVIRPGGQHVFRGIVQFAKDLDFYYQK